MASHPANNLQLSTSEPFARGGKRACYFHPGDPAVCIKVHLESSSPEALREAAPPWKRFRGEAVFDENLEDFQRAERLKHRGGAVIFEHLPKVHGFVETDLGKGLVTDLVRDADGQVSLTGKGFIVENGLTPEVEAAVEELERFLIKHLILVRDPFPHNFAFCRRKDGSLRIFLIDGLGSGTFLPAVNLIPALGRRYIRKKMQRLRKGLRRTQANLEAGVYMKPKGFLLRRTESE